MMERKQVVWTARKRDSEQATMQAIKPTERQAGLQA
jgi:hypothetical protein